MSEEMKELVKVTQENGGGNGDGGDAADPVSGAANIFSRAYRENFPGLLV